VGYYSADGGTPQKHGFAYENGAFTYFDYPGAWATFPTDIDDSGTIVGFSQFNGGLTASGFFYDGANFNLFKDGNNSFTAPYAINNAGLVVGGTGSINASRGFEMKGGQFKPVRFPGPNVAAYATGINSFGEVTGYGDDHAYLYRNGIFQNLDFPGAFATVAWGINDHHVIVGWYSVTGASYGFAFKGGKYLTFSYPGAVGTFPRGINSAGEIVGQYTFDSNTCHGFISTLPSSGRF
jgi:hypothetical protein